MLNFIARFVIGVVGFIAFWEINYRLFMKDKR